MNIERPKAIYLKEEVNNEKKLMEIIASNEKLQVYIYFIQN